MKVDGTKRKSASPLNYITTLYQQLTHSHTEIEFLKTLCKATNVTRGGMLVQWSNRKNAQLFTTGHCQCSVDYYLKNLAAIDPASSLLKHLNPNQIFSCDTWEHPLYTQTHPNIVAYLQAQQIRHLMVVKLNLDDVGQAKISLHRRPDRPGFTEKEAKHLAQMLPHLSNALLIARKQQQTMTERAIRLMLPRIRGALLLVTPNGEVLARSQGLESFISRQKHLNIRNNRLIACDGLLQQRIENELSCLGQGLPGKLLAHRSGQEITTIEGEVPLDQAHEVPNTPRILLTLRHRNALPPEPSAELLRELFELSPSEAKVAASLVHGQSITDISSRFEISIHTTRSHIAAILRKTSCESQIDLIRLLSGLPQKTETRHCQSA